MIYTNYEGRKFKVIQPKSAKIGSKNYLKISGTSDPSPTVVADTGQLHMVISLGTASNGGVNDTMRIGFDGEDYETYKYSSINSWGSASNASIGISGWTQILQGKPFKSFIAQGDTIYGGFIVFADVEEIL